MSIVVFPLPTFAAKLFVTPEVISSNQSLTQGQEFILPILLDTQGELINAVEGTFLFPKKLFKIKEIREGNSAINFWIEKPRVVDSDPQYEKIVFSGITPGGVLGTQQPIFSVVLTAHSSGQGVMRGESLRALRNDGTGAHVKISMTPVDFRVTESLKGDTQVVAPIIDTQAPDDFAPLVVNDPNLFDGQYFVVFTSQDKGVGIDHYEVREGRFGDFVEAESPYVLTDQKLNKRVYIKAFDKNGNSVVVAIPPLHPTPWYQQYGILSILVVVVIGGVFVFKKKWQKSIR
ncbi:MAG: hypothetical protein HZA80_02480 [Candidatus Taylorbacteria bacterium]|nr:hypothetical protein [Candidatus Taylorbacteria bacterium]